MSSRSNMMPHKAKSSSSMARKVEEASTTRATAGDESIKDENAPSTSQGQPQGASSSARPASATPITQLNAPIMRIKRELNEIMESPPPNCSAEMHKDDLFHWRANINGPIGTAYEGGIFKLDIRFPGAYPFRPPQIRFMTRIYHCNVDSRGVICLDVLNERWSPVMNIAKVLLSIWVLIGECNPNDPLVMGIAEQYKANRKEHDKIARYWTKRFATPKSKAGSKQDLEQSSSAQEQDPEQELDTEPPLEQDQDQYQDQDQDQDQDQHLDQELDPAPTTADSSSVNDNNNHSSSQL